MSTTPIIAPKPPWHHALLLWLFTNAAGSAVLIGLLLLLGIRDADASFVLFADFMGGLIAAFFSLVNVPLAALLFFLLPRITDCRQRQWVAGISLTVMFLLPVLLMADFMGEPAWRLIPYALSYWPAALGCAMYLYHPWLFAPPSTAAEPWV
jgi:hypothetical protein